MRRSIAVGAAFVAAIACSVVTSYDGFTGSQPAKCPGIIPDRPTGFDGDDGKKYSGALSYLDFLADAGPNGPAGWDLDNLCSCHPDKGACHEANGSNSPCDPGNTGVDNATGEALFQIFDNATTDDPPGYGVAVRLSRYNGESNDSAVDVELYNVVKVTGADGSPATKSNKPYVITVANTDIALDGTLNAVAHSKNAYVANGLLVAPFDRFDLRVKAKNILRGNIEATVDAPLRNLYLIGHFKTTPDLGLNMVDSELVGRMMETELFTAISHYGICQDSGVPFQQATEQLCKALDLPQGVPDPNANCEAISIAIAIHVAGGQLSTTTAPPIPTSVLCGEEPSFHCP